MTYRNSHLKFELELPPGWSEPGFFKRLLSPGRYAQQALHPEFYGGNGSSIKIAIGSVSPVPSPEQQRRNLEAIARRHGHEVVETDTINVGGVRHATMVCRVQDVGVLKSYSLIIGTTEYLVTARGDWQECDSIVKTFKFAGDVVEKNASAVSGTPVNEETDLADRSWRTSVLLFTLLEGEGNTGNGVDLLQNKSVGWLGSSSSAKRAVALNTLRGLVKGQHLASNQDLSNKVLNVFLSDASLAVKLAALDLLGAMKAPNPLSRISESDKKRIIEFRSTLMKLMNASQHAYAAEGVRADIARETSGKTHREVLMDVISRVDSAGPA